MMLSDLPQQDRFRLLALGIFMDAAGRDARPGTANLAVFGPHEETWKQLLRRTVAGGWLILRERGGSRKGPGGIRIKRASLYAASVPAEVYARREEILSASPFRSKEATGVTKEAAPPADALPSSEDASSKEAPRTSFEAAEPDPAVYEGSAHASFEDYEGSTQRLPSKSTKEAPDSSKEASGDFDRNLRRKSPETSPSRRQSSLRDDCQQAGLPASPPAPANAASAIPEWALPLVHRVHAAGLPGIRWNLIGDDWFRLHSLIQRKGIDAMADYAQRAAASSPRPVVSARYFLSGWQELIDAPPDGTAAPVLRAVSGGAAPPLTGTDATVAGWLALSNQNLEEDR
jgi:hypothetical protein